MFARQLNIVSEKLRISLQSLIQTGSPFIVLTNVRETAGGWGGLGTASGAQAGPAKALTNDAWRDRRLTVQLENGRAANWKISGKQNFSIPYLDAIERRKNENMSECGCQK